MSTFEEIFGFEPLPELPTATQVKPLPDLDPFPLDDYKFWIAPASEGANMTVAAVEHADLVNALVGDLPATTARVPEVDTITAAPAFVAPALVKFAHRVEGIVRCAPKRKNEIAAILDEAKAKLGGPRDQECWDRLARSCESFVTSALLAVGE
jgi:hypothetical protein